MDVRDVDETTFAEVVVEGSRTRPVVVDFWADWCGPCRQLSPLLEEMADRFAGEVDVVKVDVDANQRLAQQFRVQGIPAVKAFADGQMVSEFTGLQPPPVIEQFFAALAPSKADRLVAQAGTEVDPDRRRDLLSQALEEEVDHPAAALALAAMTEDGEEARALLARARPTPEVQQAQAALNLAHGAGDVDALEARIAEGDDAARVELGRALAATGQHEAAVDVLLAAVRVPDTREPAREALLDVFTTLGNDHPVVRAGRPRLASALF